MAGVKTPLPKVLIYRAIPERYIERIRQQCEVFVLGYQTDPPRDKFLQHIRGVDGVVASWNAQLDREAIDAAGPQLKVISNTSVGVDHVDLGICKDRGIQVGYAPCEQASVAVAEFTLALTLAVARKIYEGSEAGRQGVWGTRWDEGMWLAGKQLSGSIIGIVGLGRIGSAVAHRLRAFDVAKILYTGRNQKLEAEEKLGAEFVNFETLLERSDFVIATCSVDKSNAKMFDTAAFSKMKQGSVFVNVSRGLLVDTEALLHALTTGHLWAAALDVTAPEPLPPSHRLWSLPNVIITPHIAGMGCNARHIVFDITVRNLLAGINGQPLPAAVNLDKMTSKSG